MFRHLYSLVHVLALPILAWQLVRKYRREGHSAEITARLVGQPPQVAPGGLWIHACSLGEAQVAMTLAQAMTELSPARAIWFTSTTPAGLNRLRDGASGNSFAIFPWDLPWVWDTWLSATQPVACLLIETELWPNLMAACRRRGIPVLLANGRVSTRSMRGYQRWSWLSRPMWEGLSLALMQGSSDRDHALLLGASPQSATVCGSIKLDQVPPDADPTLVSRLQQWASDRPVLALISSHPTEEVEILAALGDSRDQWAVVIVPRHPIRSAELAVQLMPPVVRLSDPQLPPDAIVIVDRFGAIGSVLALTTVALLGGTWIPHGGQNPIEIARWRRPMIAGMHVFNFSEICAGLAEAGGLVQSRYDQLADDLARVYPEAANRGQAAYDWVDQQSGATQRQATAIDQYLLHRDAHAHEGSPL
jgi:3-deoxy-D-manno-octulosonic-acid transferase